MEIKLEKYKVRYSTPFRGEDTMRTVKLYGAGLIGRIDVRYVPYTYTDPETHDTINTIRRNDERFYYINDHLGSLVINNLTPYPLGKCLADIIKCTKKIFYSVLC